MGQQLEYSSNNGHTQAYGEIQAMKISLNSLKHPVLLFHHIDDGRPTKIRDC